ncbi:hypothetical protein BJ165DRAFT_1486783 [Panaeolus papilionaceus]|nr:hypothetical protein BJ165DRAFT_1486783 [Panaeolus papilionaceus]
MPPIQLFSALDTPSTSNSSIASYEARCNLVNAEVILGGIANGRARMGLKSHRDTGWYKHEGEGEGSRSDYVEGERRKRGKEIEKGMERDKAVARVGLNKSARLVLDIIGIAQRAGKYRAQCREIADSAFQLVNAIDAGVQHKVVDISNVLKDHVERLNRDLEVIVNTLKPYASQSWWTRIRSNSNPRAHLEPHRSHTSHPHHHEAAHSSTKLPQSAAGAASDPFEQCLSILRTRTELYSLLISCCLAQSDRQAELRARYTELTGGPLRRSVTVENGKAKERGHRRFVSEGDVGVEKSKAKEKGKTEKEHQKVRMGGVESKMKTKMKNARIEDEELPPTNTSEDLFNRYRAQSWGEIDNPTVTVRPPTPPRGRKSASKLKRKPRVREVSESTPTFVPALTQTTQTTRTRAHSITNPITSNSNSTPQLAPLNQSHYRTPYIAVKRQPVFPASHPMHQPLHKTAHVSPPHMTAPAMRFLRSRSASASAVPLTQRQSQNYPRLAPRAGVYGFGPGYANVSQGRV